MKKRNKTISSPRSQWPSKTKGFFALSGALLTTLGLNASDEAIANHNQSKIGEGQKWSPAMVVDGTDVSSNLENPFEPGIEPDEDGDGKTLDGWKDNIEDKPFEVTIVKWGETITKYLPESVFTEGHVPSIHSAVGMFHEDFLFSSTDRRTQEMNFELTMEWNDFTMYRLWNTYHFNSEELDDNGDIKIKLINKDWKEKDVTGKKKHIRIIEEWLDMARQLGWWGSYEPGSKF